MKTDLEKAYVACLQEMGANDIRGDKTTSERLQIIYDYLKHRREHEEKQAFEKMMATFKQEVQK